ncbi:DUF4124 domain-containing protein [Vibrio sp. SCSIO 43136]|uniref:DUF4124 domain-containing protein n=1 Tax=Vibrio sp. SCSIO 43136 TaxID=2819101 RepID=UPI0020757868|nr:DUF4124 domain-containing protein [Vibrio sp. SCSIO 43136]USD65201.1 DUF4124 domain-containing protein [Vibrio sp. SCSIO 43136]
MKCYLLPLITLLSALISVQTAYSQTAYTWVDKHGVRHFSDTAPEHQSETITLSSPEVGGPIPVSEPTQDSHATPEAQPHKPAKALQLSWLTPNNDQTLRDNNGKIMIALEANRKLKPNEKLQLLVNDIEFGAPQTQLSWAITNMDRGTHRLVINALKDGKQIATTPTITVHLHRARVKPTKSAL